MKDHGGHLVSQPTVFDKLDTNWQVSENNNWKWSKYSHKKQTRNAM